MPDELIRSVKEIVSLLVNRDYDEVVRITHGIRLDAAAIESAIADYGHSLAAPPSQAYDNIDIVPIRNAITSSWSVRMNLWTVDEGLSDLSIELTIKDIGSGLAVEIDDIHVL
jgi:hypothetical protein